MSPKTYTTNRSGVVHEYTLGDTHLDYHAHGRKLTIPYSELSGIESRKGADFYLKRKGHQPLAIWIDSSEQKEFISTLFKFWGNADAGTAAKAALDYGSDDKYLGKLWLVLTFAFPGMLAILLSTDAYRTYTCNRALAVGKLAQAEILKVTKNRRGNFVWRMKFSTESGQIIEGHRTPFIYNETGHSLIDDKHASVVYSPETPTCWDVSMRDDQPALNLRHRGFILLITGVFGFIFTIVTIVATIISIAKLRRVKPLSAEIQKAGQLLLLKKN